MSSTIFMYSSYHELIKVFNWGNSQYFDDAWSYFAFLRNLIAQNGDLCL